MNMHPTLVKAVTKAYALIDEVLALDRRTVREAELMTASKEELVLMVLKLEGIDRAKPPVGEVARAILTAPECAWLTYDMIQTIMVEKMPNIQTTVKNLQWYNSKFQGDGEEIVLRKPAKDIAKLLLKTV